MKREAFSIDDMKEILNKYNKEDVKISPHYLEYFETGERDITEEKIIEYLTSREFYFVEKQINSWIRYKIVYELSHKYYLIIVVKEEGKVLKVVSAYKTNKKLKEKWKKDLKSLMTK